MNKIDTTFIILQETTYTSIEWINKCVMKQI
jgi:hypothetical protein